MDILQLRENFDDFLPYDEMTQTLIPKEDKMFVPFGIYGDVETIISKRCFYPLYIHGPTGIGKNVMIEHICAKHGIPLLRTNLNNDVREEDLIARMSLKDGNIVIEEGPVLIAMRKGIPVLLDEVDSANSNNILCMQPILEGKPYYIRLKNEVVRPRLGFTVIATANTKGKGSSDGKYMGTNIQNDAFLDRFSGTMTQQYPSAYDETEMLLKYLGKWLGMPHDETQFCADIVKWANVTRDTENVHAVDESISPRTLVNIIENFVIFGDREKAVKIGVERYDDHVRNAFLDAYRLICHPEQAVDSMIETLESDGHETDKHQIR